jgi:hypothetical protein
MRPSLLLLSALLTAAAARAADCPCAKTLLARPDAFPTLVNPACSHCRDEAKRRAGELRPGDRVLCWIRGYSDGGAVPFRFFLNAYRVISDSYGVFVHDPEAGYARGFAPSYEFRFHGWRRGVMVMKHKDGTLYSCLSGLAFDGPKKGARLTPVPTLVSDWGPWLERYPNAVAYHMFDKYKPVELPAKENPDSIRSRAQADPRLKADEVVLGVWAGKHARAYPVSALEKTGLVHDTIDGAPVAILWEPRTRTAAAYRPVARQPRKYQAPRPDKTGVSPPDEGTIEPAGAREAPPRKLSLSVAGKAAAGRFTDKETQSFWDVAGRCVSGKLKGWTLEWVDGVQVKWFAWAAEHPETTIHPKKEPRPDKKSVDRKVKEIAGTAEFLRLLPKPFATLKAVDPRARTVTLQLDGEKEAKEWPVAPDAEIKVAGWWGRLEQFRPGDRVWAWLKLNRKKKPTSVILLADEASEYDFHGRLKSKAKDKPRFTPDQIDKKRTAQQAWLRQRWLEDGLPGTLTFHHVFSGEVELTLDHEAMRWGRSLTAGDVVSLTADPAIKGVVKKVSPWRERTVVRLVVGELESADLAIGQRLSLKMKAPPKEVETSNHPPDLGRPRSRAERIEWFLASIYCTCGVRKDVCTGHFYTLASCNPNGCGMPKQMRETLGKMIDRGMTDAQVLDALLKKNGPLLLKPHLLP